MASNKGSSEVDISAAHIERNQRYIGIVWNPWQISISSNEALQLLQTPTLTPTPSSGIKYPGQLTQDQVLATFAIIPPIQKLLFGTLEEPEVIAFYEHWPVLCRCNASLVDAWILNLPDGEHVPFNVKVPGGTKDFKEALIAVSIALLEFPRRVEEVRSQNQATELLKLAPDFMSVMFRLNVYLIRTRHFFYVTFWSRLSSIIALNNWAGKLIRRHVEQLGDKSIAKEVVQALTEESRRVDSQLDIYGLKCCLALVNGVYTPDVNVRRHLLAENVLEPVLSALNRLAGLVSKVKAEEVTHLHECFIMGCRSILELASEGYFWMAQMLDSHFLILSLPIGVVEDHAIVDGKSQEVAKAFWSVIDMLKLFIIFRSVLNRVVKEMKAPKKAGSLELLPKNNKIRKSLEELDRDAFGLKSDMDSFDDVIGPQMNFCLNEVCPLRENPQKKKIRWKRCSVCFATTYCSRSCQKQDWAEHKKCCKTLLSPRMGTSYLSSRLDEQFIIHLAYSQLRASQYHLPVIEQLALRKRARNPMPLFAFFNFLDFPAKFSTQSYEDAATNICHCLKKKESIRDCKIKKRMQELLKKVDARSQIIMRVQIPSFSTCEERWIFILDVMLIFH